jgi:two-component system, response regulator
MTGNKLKILLVDDDSDDAEMIMYTLRKFPSLEVQYIDDGANALKYLMQPGNLEPSLILLDLKMPRVDGIDILRALKTKIDKKHIPVAALISSKSGVQYVESFGLTPDAYLHKPVTSHEFLTVLAKTGLSNLQYSTNASESRFDSLF